MGSERELVIINPEWIRLAKELNIPLTPIGFRMYLISPTDLKAVKSLQNCLK